MSTDSTQGYNNKITTESFAFALEPDSCAYPHDFGIDLCGVWQLGCYAAEGNMDVDETYSFTGEAAFSPDDEVGGWWLLPSWVARPTVCLAAFLRLAPYA
jgi:hypothetical protein